MKLMNCLAARDWQRTDGAASEWKAREMSMGFFLVSVSRLIPWRRWGGLDSLWLGTSAPSSKWPDFVEPIRIIAPGSAYRSFLIS